MQAEHKGNTRGAQESKTAYAFNYYILKEAGSSKGESMHRSSKDWCKTQVQVLSCLHLLFYCILPIIFFTIKHSSFHIREDREGFNLKWIYVTLLYSPRMSELHIVLPHQEQLPWTEFWIFRRQHLSVPSLLSAVHRSRCCLRTEEPPEEVV